MNGWLKLHGALLDKPIWQDATPEQSRILITLLMKANYEGKEWEWEGDVYSLKPGQFVTSLPSLFHQTFALIMDACNKNEDEYIPFPVIGIIDVCEDRAHWGKFWSRITDFKSGHLSRNDYYGDLIMVLAYTIFGYGNWSNNDRIRKGLKPIRFKQY